MDRRRTGSSLTGSSPAESHRCSRYRHGGFGRWYDLDDAVHDLLQMLAHRFIRSRPVPIVRVKYFGRERVRQLQQPAAALICRDIAADQSCRQLAQRRLNRAGFRKRALEVLRAQIDGRGEMGRPTDATGLAINWMQGGLLFVPENAVLRLISVINYFRRHYRFL